MKAVSVGCGGGGGGAGSAGDAAVDIEDEGECLGVVSLAAENPPTMLPLLESACSCNGELGLTRMLGTLLAPVSARCLVFLMLSNACESGGSWGRIGDAPSASLLELIFTKAGSAPAVS